jgi:hypothetical protein
MKNEFLAIHLRRFFLVVFSIISIQFYALAADIEFFQIKIYLLKDKDQESRVDQFLQAAYIPALHRAGIEKVGVFKPVGNDTANIRKIYLLIPFTSLDKWEELDQKIQKDNRFVADGADYLNAIYSNPPFVRIESILLSAFSGMKSVGVPKLNGPRNERIYELRSYEGPTEKVHENKVQMFNKGDEIGLFKRLGFNAVFYAEVISGPHMPNLMYLTSFDNMAAHDQHWKSFVDDSYWKQLSAMPEYQNNVSHIDIILMHPAEYSDL